MTMPRFLVHPSAVKGGKATLTGAQFHHAARVLRIKPGEIVALFDGAGKEYLARVESVGREEMRLDIVRETTTEGDSAFRLTVLQSIVKAPAMDLVLQKCSELGAARLVAVPTVRSTARIPADKAHARLQRWQRIANQSAQQCGRAGPMTVQIAANLDEALRIKDDPLIALHEEEKACGIADAAHRCRGLSSASVFIGPEGGFSPEEVQRLKESGAIFASLGPRILRAETAAITATALLMYELGDLGRA